MIWRVKSTRPPESQPHFRIEHGHNSFAAHTPAEIEKLYARA